jgi:DNA-binding response OmpR family regulator
MLLLLRIFAAAAALRAGVREEPNLWLLDLRLPGSSLPSICFHQRRHLPR